LLRAIWEGASAILKFARVTLFRGDEVLALISGVGGSTDMPGTWNIQLVVIPSNGHLKEITFFLGQNLLAFVYIG